MFEALRARLVALIDGGENRLAPILHDLIDQLEATAQADATTAVAAIEAAAAKAVNDALAAIEAAGAKALAAIEATKADTAPTTTP